ncbi:PREDICTED: uncharacterized protein LOC109590026 [Amphimedon queenslandica]|uniref:Uncharacterized protein n=1 Tax=Amphimedon queenslandica TaxID=400682 RepID=A0A1X7T3C5_AMPQE|nr:PREDICTED: uncharacterized protein LOC109590026 [Amphimedon queenslandica]|eukprot:XP_019861547.1 PREDICTED: uncharacterized protein LOC109590026 [Amphimedon queenslandica]
MMAGRVQSIKDGDDDVRRCLWVAEEKVDDILLEIKKQKTSIEITGPIKNLKYFWVSGKKEAIEKICHDCAKHSMSAEDPHTNKDDPCRVKCLLQEPLDTQWKLGITLQCHFILPHDKSNKTTVENIIKKLGDTDHRYTESVIAYDIKLVQASPAWQYTAQGGGEVTLQEQLYIKALIDINSFRSDCNFICPDKVHSDIYEVLTKMWSNCTISMQEIPPP